MIGAADRFHWRFAAALIRHFLALLQFGLMLFLTACTGALFGIAGTADGLAHGSPVDEVAKI